MTLSALLVCVDDAAAEVLRRVLQELGIQVEDCPDFARAGIRLAQDRFDVVVVGGESNSEVIELLRETRLSRRNESTLAVVIVSGQESVRELFSLGVNFALYKPVAYDRALSSMRAARALMRKEKRRSARASVHGHAIIDYANVEREKATLVDVGQNGIAILFSRKFPPTSKVYFQFLLPGQTANVRLSGQIVWQDWNGRAGVQFLDVPGASRKLLNDFLNANLPHNSGGDGRADVMSDRDDRPPDPANTTVAEQSHGREGATARQAALQIYTTAATKTEDRRTQSRYACRLGAEVYRTGTSVPNRCCLTDLSYGGCYLEVSPPFPQGSSAEIVVRTHKLNLHLRGLVQASHPGHGMGVAFELKTKEQRANVNALLDYVGANTEPSK